MTPENARNALVFLDRVQITGLQETEAMFRLIVTLKEIVDNAEPNSGEHQDGAQDG